MRMRDPATSSAATARKAAEDGSPGTATSAAARCGLARERDDPAGAGRLHGHRGAEMAQHVLAVVAGGSGSSMRVVPGAFRPHSSRADFTWAEGTGTR